MTGSRIRSSTEWDPLEEVVVGVISGGVIPYWQASMYATLPESSWRMFQEQGGRPYPQEFVSAAQHELDDFATRLSLEGITVTRPDIVDFGLGFATPDWKSPGGLYAAMPRDLLLVLDDIIVEAPMSWRCRYHEVAAFRRLIKEYFRRGARWLPAPKPQLTEALFDSRLDRTWADETSDRYAVTEFEPVFDAADFVRFGRDVIVQRSHVTNQFGIDWLRQAIGPEFRIREIEVNDPHAMHIDATLIPLAPGKMLVNGERYVPNKLFSDWEIRIAPPPDLPADWPLYYSSPWLSINLLSLDEHTVIVESSEHTLQEFLTRWGFNCIPVDFKHVYTFGGSFHCTTLDVRRHGSLQSFL
jgi:glycine amidinotransferase